jgi:16S rRNA (guanine(966)-N(2))-methyltransferase RsmD
MRISGGIAKGRKVGIKKAFSRKREGDELRPTPAKVRKAIFDILGDRIIGSRFLDLYAGTGAVGIEALSRGADKAIFVDGNPARVSVIRDLTEKFGFKNSATVVKDKTFNFLKKSASVFDIIFVDPPYSSDELELILPLVDDTAILSNNGLVIAEHSSKKILPSAFKNLILKKSYKYGDTSLTVYEKNRKEQT